MNFYNSMPRRSADLIKQRVVQRNTDIMMLAYNAVVFSLNCIKVCRRVFHWNVFDNYIKMLSAYTLI